MKNINFWIKKTFVYCIGLFILALGVSVSVRSNLGVSPVNSIPFVLSSITNINFGACVTAFLSFCIVIQLLILRREFKISSILQIICSTLFGSFVGMTNLLVQKYIAQPSHYWQSLILLLISILLVAIGVTLYLEADILLLPGEGIMKAITQKTTLRFSTVKLGFDCSVVVIATMLSLLFLPQLTGVREGTIIAALGVGLVMKVLEKFLKPIVNRFLSTTA